MKRDKDIQKLADDSIMEFRNENFKQQLLEMQETNKTDVKKSTQRKQCKKFGIILSAVGSIAVVLVVLLCVFLMNLNDIDENVRFGGGVGDEIINDVELEDINTVLDGYVLNISSEFLSACEVVQREETNSVLYYRISFENDEFMSCTLKFRIDNSYEIPITCNIVPDKEIEISGIVFSVGMNVEYDDESEVYFHNVYAEAVIGDVSIYIDDFDNITSTEESGFVEFVQSVFTMNE